MKLLREVSESVDTLIESKDGQKKFYIEGIFMQGEIPNKNKRRYPIDILERETNRYIEEKVSKNRAYGELGHPNTPTINPDRISHRIIDLRREGNNIVGKALVHNTVMGKAAQIIMNEGGSLGVSSRGLGSLEPTAEGINLVQDDFYLATAGDIVTDPSAPDAIVNHMMEDIDWWWDGSDWRKQEALHEYRKSVSKFSRQQIEERQVEIFNGFMRQLLADV